MSERQIEAAAVAVEKAGLAWVEERRADIPSIGWADVPSDVFARAALTAAAEVKTRVKPLVFEEGRNGYWIARFGYQIAHTYGERWRVRLRDKVICRDIIGYDRAVAWANDHHSRAILSALTTEGDEPKTGLNPQMTQNRAKAEGEE